MKVGDKVTHVQNANKVGTVVLISKDKVVVEWPMGSGWLWQSGYSFDELKTMEEVA